MSRVATKPDMKFGIGEVVYLIETGEKYSIRGWNSLRNYHIYTVRQSDLTVTGMLYAIPENKLLGAKEWRKLQINKII